MSTTAAAGAGAGHRRIGAGGGLRRDRRRLRARSLRPVAEAFGGVDIVVSNAGAAWQGRIGEVDEAVLRKSFELNF